MRDILIPKDIESSVDDGPSFGGVVFNIPTKSSQNCCTIPSKLVNLGEIQSNMVIPECVCLEKHDCSENNIDIITPEDVVFNDDSEIPLEHIVHHIKSEHKDYYKGTSFR